MLSKVMSTWSLKDAYSISFWIVSKDCSGIKTSEEAAELILSKSQQVSYSLISSAYATSSSVLNREGKENPRSSTNFYLREALASWICSVDSSYI